MRRRIAAATRSLYRATYCCIVLLLAGCYVGAFPMTPAEALSEAPGRVPQQYQDTLTIIQAQNVAEGVSLLYRWQTDQARAQGTYCYAATFVTPEGPG